jgi:acetoin utilization protein AcuB
MLVKDWMTTQVITLDVTDTMQYAINVSTESGVSIMPVLEDGKLAGVLTDRDLKRASPSPAAVMDIQQILYHLSRLEVGAIMSRHPITVPYDYTIEEAAVILVGNKISGAPVVDDRGDIKGIITKNDLFRALIALSGLSKRGVQFGLLLEDRPGSIKDLTDIIRKYNARLVSILSTYEKAPEGHRFVYIRAFNIARDSLAQLKEDIRAAIENKGQLIYMVDHKENRREIYAD